MERLAIIAQQAFAALPHVPQRGQTLNTAVKTELKKVGTWDV